MRIEDNPLLVVAAELVKETFQIIFPGVRKFDVFSYSYGGSGQRIYVSTWLHWPHAFKGCRERRLKLRGLIIKSWRVCEKAGYSDQIDVALDFGPPPIEDRIADLRRYIQRHRPTRRRAK